jgi:SAM-dependent methyltransferase
MARKWFYKTLTTARAVTPNFVKELYRKVKPRSMQESFSQIYKYDVWDGGSGRGSTISNTTEYRQLLEEFLQSRNIQSVVDLGCGDWQFSKAVDWGDVDYVGLDVVLEVVEENRKRFGPRFRFEHVDGSRDDLPEGDLLLVKEVLQHWPTDKILEFIPRMARYRYVIITNNVDVGPEQPPLNSDIGMGGYRPLDLREKPFDLRAQELLRYRSDEASEKNVPNKLVLLFEPASSATNILISH